MPLQHFERIVIAGSLRDDAHGVWSMHPHPMKGRSQFADVLPWKSHTFIYNDTVHNLSLVRAINMCFVFCQAKPFLSEYFSQEWKN